MVVSLLPNYWSGSSRPAGPTATPMKCYYTKLCYTTDKLPVHATDTNQVSCTQILHNDVAMYNLHTKLT